MIGTRLAETLLMRGYDVVGVDRNPNRWSSEVEAVTSRLDLLDDDVDEAFDGAEFIVHLAAHSRVRPTVSDPRKALENLEGTAAVIDHARRTDAGLLFASSREVYGEVDGAVTEDEADIRKQANPYAASKAGGEALVSAARNCYGVDACVLRLANVYGRYDASDRVVPLFVSKALNGEALTIYGSGKVLDFVHVEDCVGGIVAAIERFEKAGGETFNVASGVGTSLLQLAEAVSSLVEPDVGVRTEDDRQGEVGKFVGDPTKARRYLGFETGRSLQQGLAETLEWYRDNEAVTREIRERGG